MEQITKVRVPAIILALAGFGMVYLGNAISGAPKNTPISTIVDALGVAIALAGDIAILYALYLGAKWIYKKVRNK